MSRKDEDRILHGLYFFRERIDEEFDVRRDQVLWLTAHSFADGVRWCRDGLLQNVDCGAIPDDLCHKLLASQCELPLRYLEHRRLIKLDRTHLEALRVAVTFAGADRALRLHSRLGRMDVWYQERKNGFVGLMTTVAVSLVTALLVVLVTERLYKVFAEQTRVIYEAEPKPTP